MSFGNLWGTPQTMFLPVFDHVILDPPKPFFYQFLLNMQNGPFQGTAEA